MALIIRRIKGAWFRETDPAKHEEIKKELEGMLKFIDKNTVQILDEGMPVFAGRNAPTFRSLPNIIVSDMGTVSARHGEFLKAKGEWRWNDTSTNGTYIVREGVIRVLLKNGGVFVPLKEGDVLTLGGSDAVQWQIVQAD